VRPGGVVVGDGSGVERIPAERAGEVAELGQGYAHDEEVAAALRKRLTLSARRWASFSANRLLGCMCNPAVACGGCLRAASHSLPLPAPALVRFGAPLLPADPRQVAVLTQQKGSLAATAVHPIAPASSKGSSSAPRGIPDHARSMARPDPHGPQKSAHGT